MLLFANRYNREHHIPRNDGSNAQRAQQVQHGNAGQQEDVLHLVTLPAPRLELQGEHGYLTYQQVAADGNKH